ncbi:hypothetical protein [Nitrosopumilus ureiphilus]|nr:hypothetical protein [Nitrosopumilus ureiphilus]
MFILNTTQSKTKKHIGCFGVEYKVETPRLFSMKKTVLFGMLSALTILMLNIPSGIENTYVYGTEGIEDKLSGEMSLVRNHFKVGSPVHSNQVMYDDSNRIALEERSNLKNHFSYGQLGISDGESSVDNIHEKRRD